MIRGVFLIDSNGQIIKKTYSQTLNSLMEYLNKINRSRSLPINQSFEEFISLSCIIGEQILVKLGRALRKLGISVKFKMFKNKNRTLILIEDCSSNELFIESFEMVKNIENLFNELVELVKNVKGYSFKGEIEYIPKEENLTFKIGSQVTLIIRLYNDGELPIYVEKIENAFPLLSEIKKTDFLAYIESNILIINEVLQPMHFIEAKIIFVPKSVGEFYYKPFCTLKVGSCSRVHSLGSYLLKFIKED